MARHDVVPLGDLCRGITLALGGSGLGGIVLGLRHGRVLLRHGAGLGQVCEKRQCVVPGVLGQIKFHGALLRCSVYDGVEAARTPVEIQHGALAVRARLAREIVADGLRPALDLIRAHCAERSSGSFAVGERVRAAAIRSQTRQQVRNNGDVALAYNFCAHRAHPVTEPLILRRDHHDGRCASQRRIDDKGVDLGRAHGHVDPLRVVITYRSVQHPLRGFLGG